jgi:hypothetical protein
MKLRKVLIILVIALAAVTLAVISLHGSKTGTRKPNEVASPGAENETWLNTLGERRRLSDQVVLSSKNSEIFLSLVLSGGPPRLVTAALYALEKRVGVHPDEASRLSKAVIGSLASPDDQIVGAALIAARPLLVAGNDAAIEARLLELAERLAQGPGRYALLEALSHLKADRIHAPHIALAEASLKDNAAYVRSRALRFLEVHGGQANETDRARLSKTVTRHLADSDPGVRGRAAFVLASLGGATFESLQPLLKDPIPYVKAQACSALARAGLQDDLQEVLKLASSTDMARYDIRDWTTLEGEPGCESHSGSPSGFLGEAAATALALVSRGQAKVEPIPSEDVEGAIHRNYLAVSEWLASRDSPRKE